MPWRFWIDSGRGAGRDAVIAVPSHWQQQGFGAYQYGYDKGPRTAGRATYRRSFIIPKAWEGRSIDIVFDGVMTDS
ncbi:sugar-binding domain-containing protein [Sphingomonas sp. XXL09]|uniref:sugar-binding domain-containing protein n=1 Tax=Sphingomonas sp. XXL09 TaxID=3457787 RepID=UPI00406BA4A8